MCEQVRAWTHRLLDADPRDPLSASDLAARDRHFAGCKPCRLEAEEMQQVQYQLQSLSMDALPDSILDSVLEQTVRRRSHNPFFGFMVDWRLAAAAVVTVALIGFTGLYRTEPAGPPAAPIDRAQVDTIPQEDLERAAQEARVALAVTSRALRRGGAAAHRAREVIRDEVSTALREIPIQWPTASEPGRQGGGDV